MGKDNEVPEHFGMLHSDNLTPHRAIWILATISAVVGVIAVAVAVRRRRRSHGRRPSKRLPQGFWSSFGYTNPRQAGGAAQHLADDHAGLQLRNVPAVHAELHHLHGGLPQSPHVQPPQASVHSDLRIAGEPGLHGVLPGRCRSWDSAPRWNRSGALGIAVVWAIYGGIYFLSSSKKSGRTTLVEGRGSDDGVVPWSAKVGSRSDGLRRRPARESSAAKVQQGRLWRSIIESIAAGARIAQSRRLGDRAGRGASAIRGFGS